MTANLTEPALFGSCCGGAWARTAAETSAEMRSASARVRSLTNVTPRSPTHDEANCRGTGVFSTGGKNPDGRRTEHLLRRNPLPVGCQDYLAHLGSLEREFIIHGAVFE